MSAIQKKALTNKVFQTEMAVREKVNCHLSVQYDAKDCKIYVLHFEQVWSTAEFILGNYEIQRLICGNCAPNLAVAERKDLIETFISSCIDTGGSINKVLNNAPENAGDKQKQKKKSWENQHQVNF